jgi:DNA-binding Lrp family transcriptional regulator
MKRTARKLLAELLKDCHRSDRELAKTVEMSQPTVTRMRSELVKEGFIKEFTIIPDLAKLGYEIIAISFAKMKTIPELSEKATEWMNKYPNIVFAARGEGMGKNGVMISLHRNYAEYSNFVEEQLRYWSDEIETYDTMLISLRGSVAKPLSLRYLAKALEETSED